jgi:hypothetical protein
MWKFLENLFKHKRRTYRAVWKHSFNDEVIIYPTEKGWEKINALFSENYVEQRKTEENGYKDHLWQIMEDYGEFFYHGTDFIKTTTFEIIEKW